MIPLLSLLLSFSAQAYFDDYATEVLNISRSKKTIIVDRGTRDSIAKDDHAVLINVVKGESQDKYYPVAKLKLVKLQNNISYWVSYKFIDSSKLTIGPGFLLLNKSSLLRGRKELDARKIKVVTTSGSANELKNYLEESSDQLSLKKDDYKKLEVTRKVEKDFDSDLNLIDVEKWEKDTFAHEKKRLAIYESPHLDQFREDHEIVTYEKMVLKFLEKYNTPGASYESLYKEQKRDSIGVLPEAGVIGNATTRQLEKDQYKRKKESEFAEQLRKKGDAWSDDYTDEELSDILQNIGSLREKKRRRELLAYKYNYQAHLSYGQNLLNNDNEDDTQNIEPSKYDIEVGLESYLLKVFEKLRVYTLEFSMRRSQDSFFGGDFNVVSRETSLAAQINWYPFESPNIIETPVFYFGVLARYGNSRLTIPQTDEKGNYQISSIPG